MKKTLSLFSLLMVGTFTFSQMRERVADDYYNQLAYKKALDYYKEIAKSDNSDSEIIRRTAECYMRLGITSMAEEWYKKAIENGGELKASDYYYYAQMLKANEKYLEANEAFKKLLELEPSNSVAKLHLSNPQYFSQLKEVEDRYNIQILSEEVNSEASDFGTSMYTSKDGNKALVFSSSRKNSGPSGFKSQWDESYFLDTYLALLDDNGQGVGVEDFGKKLRSRFHEGPVAFSPDNTEIFLTRSNFKNEKLESSSDGLNKLKIFSTKNENGEWSDLVDFPYNSNEYSVGHVTISLDNQIMYFVSDMPGGYGEADIWMCKREGDSWGKPSNLGPNINTEGTEMFPYVGGNGILYFSSDGHPGLGGLDLFRAKPNGSEFSKPSNMGYPLNTNYDDFAFIVDKDEKDGYFSSNRMSDEAIGNDDIYKVRVLLPFGNEVRGFVTNCVTQEKLGNVEVAIYDVEGKEIDKTVSSSDGSFIFYVDGERYNLAASSTSYKMCSETMPNVNFSAGTSSVNIEVREYALLGTITEQVTGNPIEGVQITIKDLVSGEEMKLTSDATGSFTNPIKGKVIGDNLNYSIKLDKDGYFPIENLSYTGTFNGDNDVSLNQALSMKMQKIENDAMLVINDIYFESNKYLINDQAAKELDKIVDLLNKYPTLELELRGHTDCREHKDYNMWLSRKRAQFSMYYIRKKISNKNRITAKWFGETMPVNDCNCEGSVKSDCTEEQHQENRRTEFKVVKFEEKDVQIKK